MSLIYWSTNQTPLEPEDLDNNFRELEGRIAALETALLEPYKAQNIATLTIEDDNLVLTTLSGDMLKSPLPKLMWKPRGVWEQQRDYFAFDVVQYEDCLYVCNQPHNSGALWMEGFWTLIFKNYLPPETMIKLLQQSMATEKLLATGKSPSDMLHPSQEEQKDEKVILNFFGEERKNLGAKESDLLKIDAKKQPEEKIEPFPTIVTKIISKTDTTE